MKDAFHIDKLANYLASRVEFDDSLMMRTNTQS